MTRVRLDRVGGGSLLLLLCVVCGSAWGGHPVLVPVAVAFVAGDVRARRGLLAGLVLLLPSGLGPVAAGTEVGLTIAGTMVVLSAGLTLLCRDPDAKAPMRTVTNLLILGVGSALLLPQVSGAAGAVAALLAALAIGATVTPIAAVRATRGVASTLLLTLALLLPVVTAVRSLVPDVFLQIAARQAPSDLLVTAGSILGIRTSSSGPRSVAVAALVLLTLVVLVVPAVRAAAAPVRAGTLAILVIVALHVLVVRAQGGFDTAAVADRAVELLPIVIVALVLLVASVPPASSAPHDVVRSAGMRIALTAVLAAAHSLALLGHQPPGPSGGPAGGVQLALWLAGSLAGLLLAPSAARVLLSAGREDGR